MPVYVLAGGASERFGVDKATFPVHGVPLASRVAQLAAPLATRTTLLEGATRSLAELGYRTVKDRRPGLGPMAGVEAALADLHRNEPWALVLPCDLLALHRPTIRRMLTHWRPGTQAVVHRRTGTDMVHPFPGAYHIDLLPAVRRSLDAARTALQPLLLVHATTVDGREFAEAFPQANTREELEAHDRG